MSIRRNFLGKAFELVYDGWVRVWSSIAAGHEVVEKTDAVAFLIYNKGLKAVAMVIQERPAANRRIMEVPAGHMDQADDDSPQKAMLREARQELGLLVNPDHSNVFRILNFAQPLFSSPGILTEKIWLGYAAFDHDDFDQTKIHFGVVEENEEVERRWIPIEELADMEFEDLKTFALVQWFLREQYPQIIGSE